MSAKLPVEMHVPYAEVVEFLDNAAIGIHRVGPDGTVLWMNRAELALLGYEAQEIVGKHISAVHADSDVAEEMIARLARDETLHDYEARLIAKDGSIKHVLIDANVYRKDGMLIYTRCFMRDITARRTAELELERTIQQNQVFANLLGHDLRNPLGAMLMAAQLAIRRSSDDAATKPLQRILLSGERMSRMIDQLLDFTRARMIGGIPIERKLADLEKIITQALADAELAEHRSRFRVETEGDLTGAFDADRLTQVFSTLVSNAMHHGTPGTECRLRAVADAAYVYADVHNAGEIPADALATLFDPLSAPRHDKRRALGLGLFIAEQLVRAHGGSLTVSSSPGEGTTFFLKLPRAEDRR